MTKRKLQRFAENYTFPNMFQPSFQELLDGFTWKGNWKGFFGNDNPIILELGCGKGDYTVGLARVNPDKNYIGIDLKGARMWRGCKQSQEENLKNVAFIRNHVQNIRQFFAPGEVSEIWITFPDPQPRESREHKRLTAPRFLNIYRQVLVEQGLLHLKTDNQELFDYSLGVIAEYQHILHYATHDLYREEGQEVAKMVQTFYEQMFLAEGKSICYAEFCLSKPGNGKTE
jgi:tRNA (guanine-N7-)-methyltransferase